MTNVLDYEDVLKQSGNGTKHLLLGNGFSIAFIEKFAYRSLLEQARNLGMKREIYRVFEHFGTSDFEEVLSLLEWILDQYGICDSVENMITADIESVKEFFVGAISTIHPHNVKAVPPRSLENCRRFIDVFDNVFTLNYDLLLYWAVLQDTEGLSREFKDGFGFDPEDNDRDKNRDYLVWHGDIKDNPGIHYIHGALHLYASNGQVRKYRYRKSDNTSLMDLIRNGMGSGQFPLFVSEGDFNKKLYRIRTNEYLNDCLNSFEEVMPTLFVYGFSFGNNDEHIIQAIENNTGLENVYVGIHGDPNTDSNQKTMQRAMQMEERRKQKYGKPLSVRFFDSSTAPVWGQVGEANL